MQARAKTAASSLGGKDSTVNRPLPQRFEFGKHVTERLVDIKKLLDIVEKKGKGSGGKRGFQEVHHRERRRAASHNPFRIPWRFRKRILREFQRNPPKGGRKAMKYRYRKYIDQYNYSCGYGKRSLVNHWFETHMWHAKRFHFLSRNGLKIPLNNNNKIYRSTYRSGHKSLNHCIVTDRSWLANVEIKGESRDIIYKLLLDLLSPVECDKNELEASDDYKRLIANNHAVSRGVKVIFVDLYQPAIYKTTGHPRKRVGSFVRVQFLSQRECILTIHPEELIDIQPLLDKRLSLILGQPSTGNWINDKDRWVADQYRFRNIPTLNRNDKLSIERVWNITRFDLFGRGAINALRDIIRIDYDQSDEFAHFMDALASDEGLKTLSKYPEGFVVPIEILLPKILGPLPNKNTQKRHNRNEADINYDKYEKLGQHLQSEKRSKLIFPARLKSENNRSTRRRPILSSLAKIEEAIKKGYQILDTDPSDSVSGNNNPLSNNLSNSDYKIQLKNEKEKIETQIDGIVTNKNIETVPIILSFHLRPNRIRKMNSSVENSSNWQFRSPFSDLQVTLTMARGCGGKNLLNLFGRASRMMIIGLIEFEWLMLSARWKYEGSGYDTPGNSRWRLVEAKQEIDRWKSHPPSKRLNYPLLRTPCPFIPEWGLFKNIIPPKLLTCTNILGGQLYRAGVVECIFNKSRRRKELTKAQECDYDGYNNLCVEVELTTSGTKGTIMKNAMIYFKEYTFDRNKYFCTKRGRNRLEKEIKKELNDYEDSDDAIKISSKRVDINRSTVIIPQRHLTNPLLPKNQVEGISRRLSIDSVDDDYHIIEGWVMDAVPACLAMTDLSYGRGIVSLTALLESIEQNFDTIKWPKAMMDKSAKKWFRNLKRSEAWAYGRGIEFPCYIRNPGELLITKAILRLCGG